MKKFSNNSGALVDDGLNKQQKTSTANILLDIVTSLASDYGNLNR